ncbi:MAG: M20/M25/M40 family metallo-hydrolase [Fimbriimonadaceae bacterium]|nr:M20/M25/M40 family metallo-hydrolase [Fimbriimonadaceae bacterium]
MNNQELLEFHRNLVATKSISHEEGPIADWVTDCLCEHGVDFHRWGDNVVATVGEGPHVVLNSHLDTVPPCDGWTRDPWKVEVENGNVYGLGSNDAKASGAALTAAFLRLMKDPPCRVTLLLVPEEETGGNGAEISVPRVAKEIAAIDAGIVGEPTGLDIALAQKGLLIIELEAEGDACHAAHANRLGARNPIFTLAKDLVALESTEWGEPDPDLGPTTMQATVVQGGEARNQVPGSASVALDFRTAPGLGHEKLIQMVESIAESKVGVRSRRLEATRCDADTALVRAAKSVRPEVTLFGSATMSDLAYMRGFPAVKCGPGDTSRSHRPDEFVEEQAIVDAAAFYTAWVRAFAQEAEL